jgi:hypothetical protein
MLEIAQKAAWVAAFAFVVTVWILMVTKASMPPDAQEQKQHLHQPGASNGESDPKAMSQGVKREGSRWSDVKEKASQYKDEFIEHVERREKVYVALSSIAVAAFTFLLFAATVFLFVSGEKSADAAKKSAEIAERALIAGQRAFVSVYFEASAHKSIQTGKITNWSFTPVWQNPGDTPTRDMQNHINIRRFDGPLPSDWNFPDLWDGGTSPEDRLSTPLGIAPKGNVRGQTVGNFSIDQMQEIIDGTRQLYMWGWATYNDVFPETSKHVTRFAVQILAGGDPTDKDRTSFTFRFIRKYNCSDEECAHQGYPAEWAPRQMVAE